MTSGSQQGKWKSLGEGSLVWDSASGASVLIPKRRPRTFSFPSVIIDSTYLTKLISLQ